MAKLHRAGTVLCYLLAALLMAFYLLTLWQGLNPGGSCEYRAFYLDQQLAFWPGRDGLSVQSGQTLDFATDAIGPDSGAGHLAHGECQLTDAGWQTVSNTASIYLTAESDVVLQGSLQVQGTAGQELILTVSNSQNTTRVVLAGDHDRLTFPCAIVAGELLELRLEADAGNSIIIQELSFL